MIDLFEVLYSIEVQLIGNGEVWFFGMSVECDMFGVVVDILGIGGM